MFGHTVHEQIDLVLDFLYAAGVRGYTGDGGPATEATFYGPSDIACSASGDIFVTDRYNHAIRRIDPSGTITTVVGTGEQGDSPNGTIATEYRLYNPAGITYVDATSTLYIADMYHHQVVKVRNP